MEPSFFTITATDSAAVATRGAVTAMAKTAEEKALERAFPGAVAERADVHPLVTAIKESPFYDGKSIDSLDMAMRLLDMSTDDMLNMNPEGGGDLTHGEDVIGVPFMLRGVKFNEGDKNPDFPLYAVMDVTFNGEEDVMSCGAQNVVVAAFKLARDGDLPRMVKIVLREKKTRAGYNPMFLLAATDEDVAQAEEKAQAQAKHSEGF